MKNRLWLTSLLAVPVLVALALVGCGGDDDDGGSGPLGGTGNDEDYVAALCKAVATFDEDLQEAVAKASTEDPEKIVEAFQEPLEAFLANLKRANPPADLKDYHSQFVAQMQGYVDALEDGDPNALDDAEELPEPPADVMARLEKIAADNPDCQEADFLD